MAYALSLELVPSVVLPPAENRAFNGGTTDNRGDSGKRERNTYNCLSGGVGARPNALSGRLTQIER